MTTRRRFVRGAVVTALGLAADPLALVRAPRAHAATASPAPSPAPTYDLRYDARIVPTERVARVTIEVARNNGLLDFLRMRIDPQRQFRFEGDGTIELEDERVTWRPANGTSQLRYSVRLDHLHDSVGYDARCTDKWALFRGEDLVPPISSETRPGARSLATLRLRVPVGWEIETRFPKRDDGTYSVDQAHRFLDRPTGWILVGKLDVTRERIVGTDVTIAGPAGQGLRRFDILAMLRWTLPTLAQIVGKLPPRLLIVGANDPMWRGGLSGPESLFLHSALPLISSDGTSTLLHEVVHVATNARSVEDGDWVVEGLAEYYALQLLLRSGTISEERYRTSLARLEKRGRKAERLRTARASGEVTARAVGVLAQLDDEIRANSDDRKSLDDVLRALASERIELSTESFRALVTQVTGVPRDRLPALNLAKA
ncbi:MAG TPA: hypothetical protein VIS07_04130 [Candidatus Binatia bacterium]